MKLCWHDWFVHKKQGHKSLRHKLILDGGNFPLLTLGTIFMLPISWAYAIGFPWYGAIPWVIVIGLVLVVAVTAFLSDVVGWDYDPWKATDRSCLKCGEMKFDATKADEKWAEGEVARAFRQEKIDKSYQKRLKRAMKKMANRDLRKTKAANRYKGMIKAHKQTC